ncbi:TPA: sce7726 family protein [Aeromonas veronii]
MRDIDVRRAVHKKILMEHHKDPDTLVIDEFSLNQGLCRVDIAVLNGRLHGYELKSASDTLERLPTQIQHYSAVMDRVTLVVADNHADKALPLLPSWWGVKLATLGLRGAVHLKTLRKERQNPGQDKLALATLLWKEEVINILQEHGFERGLKNKPRRVLWQLLATELDMSQLRDVVRTTLKARSGWRADVSQE